MDRFQKAFALFDAYNQLDSNTLVWEGDLSAGIFYVIELYNSVLKLGPHVSEAVLLALRSVYTSEVISKALSND